MVRVWGFREGRPPCVAEIRLVVRRTAATASFQQSLNWASGMDFSAPSQSQSLCQSLYGASGDSFPCTSLCYHFSSGDHSAQNLEKTNTLHLLSP